MRTRQKIAFSTLVVFLLVLSGVVVSSRAFAHVEVVARMPSAIHPFTLTSPEFSDGGRLSTRNEYTGTGCHGSNIAPILTWSNIPANTSSFALVMNDLDAAVAGGFHHWIMYNVPPMIRTVRGNAPYTEGTTSLGTHAYFGPCPPRTGQIHHYAFTLYALSLGHIAEKDLPYERLIQAITGHVVGATTTIGTFRRISARDASN